MSARDRCHPRMVTPIPDPTTTTAWRTLEALAAGGEHSDLGALFSADPRRVDRFSVEAVDLRVDFSKQLVSPEVRAALIALAEECGLADRFARALSGQRINTTEDRAALHTALRRPRDDSVLVDGTDVMPAVHATLDHMKAFSEAVRSGIWEGSTGRAISTVVNIGIGGSDLGPAMATQALWAFARPDIDVRFISNVDPADLVTELAGADAASTLFIVASKTFSTIETMMNATSARQWLFDELGDAADVSRHFVALSTNAAAVTAFGIDPANMFEFWDWVGGRYSLCSAIGLSLMIAIGDENFSQMLSGFRAMDRHVAESPLHSNAPFLAALVGIWNRNFLGMSTLAVLPYSEPLRRFTAYLQQLDMESNGKSVRIDGSPVTAETAPIVWGEPGTNGQHAFFQLLHQGSTVVPADLIGFLEANYDRGDQHRQLFANMVAQAEALAFGRSAEEVAKTDSDPDRVPHRTFGGNRPTTTTVATKLTPSVLGQLIAFYEHKVFAQGAIWGINSFDQWGVELGKELAMAVVDDLDSESFDAASHDASTSALIELYRTT